MGSTLQYSHSNHNFSYLVYLMFLQKYAFGREHFKVFPSQLTFFAFVPPVVTSTDFMFLYLFTIFNLQVYIYFIMIQDEHPADNVSETFFYKQIPKNIKLRRAYSGLCKYHHVAYDWEKCVRRNRPLWHKQANCRCQCIYCDYDGCDHGCKCNDAVGFSCSRCLHHFCPVLETDVIPCVYTITRYMPFKQGTFKSHRPVEFTYHSSRKQMLTRYFHEVDGFKPHYDQVCFHKKITKTLFATFPNDVLVCRWDFIQNIELKRGTEIAQNYYSRKQIAFLVNAVYFRNRANQLERHFYEYFMDFLMHCSLVFQKCMDKFITVQFPFPDYITTIVMLSDGAKSEFRSRHTIFWASCFYRKYGFKFRMCVDPPYHGKNDCDSRGGVIKRGLRRHIVKPGVCVDTAHHLVQFVNDRMHRTFPGAALFVDITPADRETLGVYIPRIQSFYDYIFSRNARSCRWRTYPCFCQSCLSYNFDACLNADYCGPLIEMQVRREGVRGPPQRVLDNTSRQPQLYEPRVNAGYNAGRYQWEVHSIISKRTSSGSTEYLVNWVDWDTDTWVAAADLLGSQHFVDAFEATFCAPNIVAVAITSNSDSDSDSDSDSISGSTLQPVLQQHQIPVVRVQVLIHSDDGEEQQQHMCDDVSEDVYWEVEQILLKRTTQGVPEYFVKWLNYDEDVNTWVCEEDLNCPDLLRAFNASLE